MPSNKRKRITDTPEAARKGINTRRGQPIFYSEKKQRTSLTLTPTAMKGLENLAGDLNLSISELVERIGRGAIPIGEDATDFISNEERMAQRIAELISQHIK